MAAIKPVEQSSDKWMRRASVAGADYLAGVQAPRTSWATASAAAEGNYKTGVTQAATAGRYGTGIRKAGDEAWRTGSTTKGPTRFAEGVSLSVGKWQSGFQPYQAAIGAITLPPRGPAGSPANMQRVNAIATALRQVRERSGK